MIIFLSSIHSIHYYMSLLLPHDDYRSLLVSLDHSLCQLDLVMNLKIGTTIMIMVMMMLRNTVIPLNMNEVLSICVLNHFSVSLLNLRKCSSHVLFWERECKFVWIYTCQSWKQCLLNIRYSGLVLLSTWCVNNDVQVSDTVDGAAGCHFLSICLSEQD